MTTPATHSPAPSPPYLTLRDQFAMAALTGLIAYPRDCAGGNTPLAFGKRAYEYADAMLKARGQ